MDDLGACGRAADSRGRTCVSELELVDQQLHLGLGLGVAGQHDLASVGRRQMDRRSSGRRRTLTALQGILGLDVKWMWARRRI